MNSMTGYGRGEATYKGLLIAIELTSVNRKQAEISLNLPRELESLEPRIREQLTQNISRGRVNFRLTADYGKNRSAIRVEFNRDLARQYLREMHALAKDLKINQSVSLESLLRVPGIVETHSPLEDPDALWKTIQKALKSALSALLKMRAREGTALEEDLKTRMNLLRQAKSAIAAAAPDVATKYRDVLLERLKNAGLAVAMDDERLLKEIVLFADRSDIAEELARLESHFNQFEDCLRSREPVGRKLDFLVQEMNREINTIGSKANDAAIASQVIIMKTELERFREQAQNVE